MKPIYMEQWWLDAVCAGKHWEEILPDMPCLIRNRWWMRWVAMPQQTQIGGMWVDPQICTIAQVHEKAVQIDAKLREMNLHYYYQQYPVGSPLPQELKQLGYKIKERVTYRLDDLSDLDKVIDGFSKNKKRQLQKALSMHAECGMNVEDFYRFHMECMAERGKQVSYSREFLLVLDRKLQRQQQREILRISDADGHTMAAAYLIWDQDYVYYLIPCVSEVKKDSGAGALLALESIKFARKIGRKFDFEGSMKRGIANHYKQFGATPTIYYGVEKLFHWIAFPLRWFGTK